jgi:hypothetical protein
MTRHPLDPIAFVGGALFTVLGVFALFGGDASRLNAGWIWPATLAVVGLALMAVTARSTVVRQRKEHDDADLVPTMDAEPFPSTEAEPFRSTDGEPAED